PSAQASTDDGKVFLTEIMDEWSKLDGNDPAFNPVDILTRLSERFETETADFHKQDPDPFDNRHPVYIIPNCSFGKLLKLLTKQHSNFMDKVINTYLCSTTKPADAGSPSVQAAAARFLLAVMPGLDVAKIFSSSNETVSLLYRWIKTKPEPLRTYATGIFSFFLEHQDLCSQRHAENAALVNCLLFLNHKIFIQSFLLQNGLRNLLNVVSTLPIMSGDSGLVEMDKGETYTGVEPEAQKSALAVLVNCVCGPLYKFDGAVARVVNGTPQSRAVSKSIDESRKKIWESVKTHNGIKILLHLLTITQPAVHADDLRLLACKALCGLCRCESVKQIASMLPMFNNGQLQALTRQPVMQDRKKHHERFRKYMEELTEQVSGKPSAFRMDLESLRKAHIVSQTMIRYDNRELLQLIHNHLQWSGLHTSAAALAREASLNTPTTYSPSVLTTPKNLLRHVGGTWWRRGCHGDAKQEDPFYPRNPCAWEHPDIISNALNLQKMKFRNQMENDHLTDCGPSIPPKYHLSSTGRVTVVEPGLPDKGKSSSPTLNTIVADFLKAQHSLCENPVVTVPEFSLMRSHCCPKPLYRAEAPINMASRYFRRQITPRWGGVGGCGRDRQFIYSRFRPSFVFRPPDQDNVPYTCCSFTPDDLSVVLGNYQGDLTVHSLDSDNDRVIENCAHAPIVCVQPARDGERLLLVAEGVFNNSCALFSMETLESKFSYRDVYYVEFSKTTQDRVIGTKDSAALIYDAASGQKIQTLEKSDMPEQYVRNKATFSPNDELVLSDGMLWDPRASSTQPIHKFDKFNSTMSGIFHPRGTEVIINTEVWDLRNYHLLHTVPYIDQCTLHFNRDSTVMYAAKSVSHLEMEEIDEVDADSPGTTTFLAIDAHNYRPISVTDTKHKIYDFAADGRDCHVAVIERQVQMESYHDGGGLSVCRLYEVGKVRGEDDEDEEEDVVGDADDDDDPNEDDNSSSHSEEDELDRFRRSRQRRRRRERGSGEEEEEEGSDNEGDSDN
uniref:Uncharacterized protein n=1 Tax=Ciona savignyi TaxID=51511 RepID=H2Z2G7_CIOSA